MGPALWGPSWAPSSDGIKCWFSSSYYVWSNVDSQSCPFGGSSTGSSLWQCVNAPACPTGQNRNSAGLCIATPTCDTTHCSEATLNPVKSNGPPPSGLCARNPINIGTGNKYQFESDYQGAGDFPLIFERTYNSSSSTYSVALGVVSGWRHSYERSIVNTGNSNLVAAYRADGTAYSFTLAGNGWLPVADVNLQLNTTANGWQLTTEDGSVETYDTYGKLLSIKSRSGATQTLTYGTNGLLTTVTHSNGRNLSLSYDNSLRIIALQDPAGGQYHYSYNGTGNLISVTYPDQKTRTYLYNETGNVPSGISLPHALTGILDEKGLRYATYQYDAQGRAISTQHAGGAEYAGVSYGTNSSRVTDALGAARTTGLQVVQGVVKSTGSNQPAGAGCSAAASNVTYDANGNTASRTDFNGNLACYAYDLTRNLENARVEGLAPGSTCPTNIAAYTPAANSSERVITTNWNASYRLPAQINETGRQTSFSYDAAGNLLSKTVTDTASQQSRTWTYTYNSLGQILTEDGPRTDVADVASYTYYSDSTANHKPGDLQSKTNALGHVTTYTSYDANGRLLSLTDPNGLAVSLTYDPRGRLTGKTVGGNTSTYNYDAVGNLIKITQPTGVAVSYSYDAAHRLTDITDALGGKIHYTLDGMGNRTQEVVTDALGNTVKTHRRVFDALSRLQQDIGAYNQTVSYQYDANGNLTQINDANSHVTHQAYDSLNRLVQSTDAMNGLTDYNYDALDRLTQVTDAANHSTVYSYNGLGDLTQLSSPNTGISLYGYDSAGNRTQKTDANNTLSNYSYDALNRLTAINYTGSDASANLVNSYDGAPGNMANQKGRLTASQRGTTSNSYSYDLFGNLTSATGFALPHPGYGNSIGYSYNADNRVTDIAFSTYRDIQYQYNAAGQVSQIAVHDTDNGAFSTNGYNVTRTLASNIQHLPFGPVTTLSYGNGLALSRGYDLDYRLSGQNVGTLQSLAYGYDPGGNLQTVNDLFTATNSQSFGYDTLNRLINASGPNSFTYSYDAVGNRSLDVKNAATTNYNYDLNSQKLLSQTGARPDTLLTDATGNVSQSRGNSYGYAPDQRLASVLQGNSTIANYSYDSQGQRIAKTTATGTTNFDYGQKGQLLGENGPALAANYVYLDGEPLARVDYNLSDTTGNVAGWNVAYFHNNQIGAPLLTTDQNGQVSWTGQMEPFGNTQISNPNITQNLRFPGQYYDQETGLFYNMNRFYDPTNGGRYLQSDPIGLRGGINTYTYVGNNPLKYVDPLGLEGKIYYPVPNIPTIPGTPSYDLAKSLTKFFNNIYNNSSSDEDGDQAANCPPKRFTSPKHHKNSNSPEPDNVDDLFDKSIVDNVGRRWVKDEEGVIHRFSKPSNGETHWNGSTSGEDPIRTEDIPNEIRKQLNKK